MITFNQLFNYRVIQKTNDFSVLDGFYYSHLHHVSTSEIPYEKIQTQSDIQIHYLENHCFDGRRIWQLFYVTFKEQLIMFCSNAGREGDDKYYRAIVNLEQYKEMIRHLFSLRSYSADELDDKLVDLTKLETDLSTLDVPVYHLEDDAVQLATFYDYSINDVFSSW